MCSELLKIKTYRAPRDKIICVLNCCKVIFGSLTICPPSPAELIISRTSEALRNGLFGRFIYAITHLRRTAVQSRAFSFQCAVHFAFPQPREACWRGWVLSV